MWTDDEWAAVMSLRVAQDHERIAFIAQLITECRWLKYKHPRELASAWGTTDHVVRGYYKDACISIQTHIMDNAPTLPFQILERVDHIASSAMNKKRSFMTKNGDIITVDDPDHKAALKGMELVMDALGMKGKKDRPVVPHIDQLGEKPLDELMRMAKEAARPALVATTNGEPVDETDQDEACQIEVNEPHRGEARRGWGNDEPGEQWQEWDSFDDLGAGPGPSEDPEGWEI